MKTSEILTIDNLEALSENLEKMKNYAEQIELFLMENNMHVEEVGYNAISVFVEILWGDWKHDHLRTKYLISEKFPNIQSVCTEETETDGSDCYSAIHYFYFN